MGIAVNISKLSFDITKRKNKPGDKNEKNIRTFYYCNNVL